MRLGRTSERVQALRQVPLLRDLDRTDLEEVGKISYSVTRQEGEPLLLQGDVGTELLLLVEGTARVELDGKAIGEVGPNSILGEMALIDNHRRSASVIAVTPCEVLVIPYGKFWDFLGRAPSVQRTLLITLSRRVRDLEAALNA